MRKFLLIMLAAAASITLLFVLPGPAQQGSSKAGPAQQTKAKPTAKTSAKPAPAASKGATAAALTTTISTGDWPMYSHDLTSTRYSPLKQITTANVAKLKQAWTYRPPAPPAADDTGSKNDSKDKGKTIAQNQSDSKGKSDNKNDDKGKAKDNGAARPGAVNPEATPIVVAGVMYIPAGKSVIALNADTGKELWSYQGPTNVSSRSIAYWPGDGTLPARVLFVAGTDMLALNASTGHVDPGFGKEGTVNVEITWGGAPYIYKNLVIVGNNNGERSDGPVGDTKVYDARTGKELWRFQTIAQPGDPNHATWLDDGWKQRAGVNPWGWYFSVDEARDLLFMPLGSAAGNYYGGDRPGPNLYANSLVAVNATTGKYVWHFQLVHHDLWDIDLPAAPSLFDIHKDGKTIPALAVISKNALMFLLNRETGEPIFGVEERPVPRGDVPGEWYSPTQPFPVKPPPLARNSFNKEDDFVRESDTTPEHVKACEELWDKAGGFINQGPFTPFGFHEAGAPPKSYVQFPGNGGPNWGGTSADPTTGFVFVSTQDTGSVGWIEKKVAGGNYGNLTDGSPLPLDRASTTGPGPYSTFTAGGMPCQRPPWGRLFAINANTGDIAWQVVLGIHEKLPKEKQKVGNVGYAGPTSTAGGLLFSPSSDSYFHAFDSKTGQELWSVHMDGNMNANSMTYAGKSGRQYVAGVAGGAVVVWTLP